MPIEERRPSFVDPLAVRFEEEGILVFLNVLGIDNLKKVIVYSEDDCVMYYDFKTDGVWQQIAVVSSQDNREIRRQVAVWIRKYVFTLYYEEGPAEMFDPKDFQFALGPAIRGVDGKPSLSGTGDLVGIWYREWEGETGV